MAVPLTQQVNTLPRVVEEVDQELLEEMDTVTIRAPSALEVLVLVTNIMCKAMPMIYHKKMIPIELLVIERVGLP